MVVAIKAYFEKLNIVYYRIEKTGSTSTAVWLRKHNGIMEQLRGGPYPSNVKNLVTVRNPFPRLVSLYFNVYLTINNNENISFEEYVNKLLNNTTLKKFEQQCYQIKHLKFDFIIHLDKYEEGMRELAKYIKTDEPFLFKNKGTILYDSFLYNLPAYNIKAFDFVDRSDNTIMPADIYRNVHFPYWKLFYNDELIKKVLNIYEEDFNFFGFEKDFDKVN